VVEGKKLFWDMINIHRRKQKKVLLLKHGLVWENFIVMSQWREGEGWPRVLLDTLN